MANNLFLAAIAGADHMVSPEADKHDSDGWYRNTIRELIALVPEAWELGYGTGYVEGRKGAGPSAPKPSNPFKERHHG